MSLYPTLEDMKVDLMIQFQTNPPIAFQAQTRPMPSSAPPGAPAPSAPLPYALYPSSGAGEAPGMGDKFQALYPTLDDYMGISLSRDLPPEMAALAVRPPAHVAVPQTGASRLSTMVAPVSGSSVGLRRAEVSHGIREVVLCKDQDKKVGLRLESINKGIFVVLVQANSPAALVGLRFGDQILTIDDEVVAGYSVDKVHNMIRKANPECIVMAVRDRPFERTVTMHKSSTGHIGFAFRDGKIISLVKDSSATRNGLLIDHQLLEVNGQNVVGIKDPEITRIIESAGNVITVTVMPSFIYDHMIKQ
ncbi:syntenin, putative [Ixodes scapularis]|uniref:Syntenin, putative n=1 Tax=Ixodes scapularis TaxID=6945 RepID=B7PNL5_IXOSC|nr:syntenin, putative [Ixodes scapularis]|eukprot:XP_002435363.1 syntenin, putative [Ixodes scapularis]